MQATWVEPKRLCCWHADHLSAVSARSCHGSCMHRHSGIEAWDWPVLSVRGTSQCSEQALDWVNTVSRYHTVSRRSVRLDVWSLIGRCKFTIVPVAIAIAIGRRVESVSWITHFVTTEEWVSEWVSEWVTRNFLLYVALLYRELAECDVWCVMCKVEDVKVSITFQRLSNDFWTLWSKVKLSEVKQIEVKWSELNWIDM